MDPWSATRGRAHDRYQWRKGQMYRASNWMDEGLTSKNADLYIRYNIYIYWHRCFTLNFIPYIYIDMDVWHRPTNNNMEIWIWKWTGQLIGDGRVCKTTKTLFKKKTLRGAHDYLEYLGRICLGLAGMTQFYMPTHFDSGIGMMCPGRWF